VEKNRIRKSNPAFISLFDRFVRITISANSAAYANLYRLTASTLKKEHCLWEWSGLTGYPTAELKSGLNRSIVITLRILAVTGSSGAVPVRLSVYTN